MDAITRSERAGEPDRVLTEDALKHIYRSEQQGLTATVESLAGAVGVDSDRVARMLAELQSAGLATLKLGGFRLTTDGTAYALQVIRAHRLYETYLAEQTGSQETAWHHQADIHEHKLTESQVNELAQRLGHPQFDPHGDPIPTADGKLPPAQGNALSDWPVGPRARIVHVEDEPEPVFAQLAAIGLCPGLEVRVVESTPQRVVVWADGEQHVLAPVVAVNVSVEPVAEERLGAKIETESLSALGAGVRARVANLSPRCRGPERRRLLDLGIVPDTIIEAVMRSPSGDPTAYRVRRALVALRREQAELINVVRLQEETT